MSSSFPSHVFLFFLAVVLTFLVYIQLGRKKSVVLPLPPGPPKLPIIGNLLNLHSQREWECFHRWGKEYKSDIIHLNAAGMSLIILNSVKAANDLLDKRSSIYSNRPNLVLVNRVMGCSWMLAFMAYGPAWKQRRRFFQRHIHPSNTAIYKPHEIEHVRKMLLQLLQTPESFTDHIKHAIGGLMLSIAYGTKVKQNDSHLIVGEQVADYLSESLTPISILADSIPFLVPLVSSFLPKGALSKSKAEWSGIISRFRNDPFVHVQALVASGMSVTQNSLVSRSLEELSIREDEESQHEVIKDVAGMVFIGGLSATNVTLQTFVLAMLYFPDAKIKAQEELDRVVGRERLPDLNDESDLPYLGALLKEVYRWRPSAPLGMPHCLDKDDEYNGYFIPGQSVVLGNAWAMLHDEIDYPDPESFKPERYLKNGLPDLTVRDPATIVFGFGRRVCPAAHLGLSTVWIMAASMLSAFDILKPLDEYGTPIDPTVEYDFSLTLKPKSFKCRFQPRHEGVEALIRSNIDISHLAS